MGALLSGVLSRLRAKGNKHLRAAYSTALLISAWGRAKAEKIFNLHVERMTKLMSELIAIERAPHVHQNARNLVNLEHIAAAELEAAMKCEEGKEIALMAECVLDVDTDARHQGVESAALGPDCSLALEHGLYEV